MPCGESRLEVCFFLPVLGFSVVFFHHLVLVDSSPKWPTFWKFQSFFWYGFSEYRWLRVLKPSMRCSHQWVIIKVGLGISRTNADSQWNPNRFRLFSRDFRLFRFFFPGSASPRNLPSWVKYHGKFENFAKEFRRTKFIAVERVSEARGNDIESEARAARPN